MSEDRSLPASPRKRRMLRPMSAASKPPGNSGASGSGSLSPDAATKLPPGELNLAHESEKMGKAATGAEMPVKTTGLHRAPISGGVKTATARFDLPSPPVAVRNLVEQAQFAHLCTTMSGMHHRRAGYPFGTLVDYACDGAGYPLLCLSPLAIHARNIMENPRCSLVIQSPGWTGLANARVTIFGDVYQLPADMQTIAGAPHVCARVLHAAPRLHACPAVPELSTTTPAGRQHSVARPAPGAAGWADGCCSAAAAAAPPMRRQLQTRRHNAGSVFTEKYARDVNDRWVSGNFTYFRMSRIVDVYFVGGFGTVQWIGADEYTDCRPDDIVLREPNKMLKRLNAMFQSDMKQILTPKGLSTGTVDDAQIISIDARGVDVRVRIDAEYRVERVGFDAHVHTFEEAEAVIRRAVGTMKALMSAH